MCGISGAFSYSPAAEAINQAFVSRLNDLQSRRGPDGVGMWSSSGNQVVLGHRRLAIIDTGAGGAQPMSDASGRWVITFNGEIYNYRALRVELERQGCVFHTSSDTEVLINVVALWGEAGLSKLRGMYAFALWDSLQQELWLARDPYGIKPLYVAEHKGTVWFASQARALANCGPIDTRRDAAALTGLYLWGHVPEPYSWWAGIRMLPAGHLQRIRFGAGLPPAKPFQRIQDAYVRSPARPLAPGELRDLLMRSIEHHLVADVPVGIFLSAGIDSSVIAALAAELGTKLRTVTLAFDEYSGTPNDEAPLAEDTASLLGSDHTTVRINRDEFSELLDGFLRSMDQPTIDGLNTYLISRAAAKQGLKVALSGLGGDELFGGYPSFRQIPTLVKWGRNIPAPKRFGQMTDAVFRMMPLPGMSPKVAGLLSHSTDIPHAYLLRRALYIEGELDALLDRSWLDAGLEQLSTITALKETLEPLVTAGATGYSQVAALESSWYMRNQLLRDTDWSSMAHSLEVRVPFVDAHLLDHLGPAIASASPPTKKDLAACTTRLPVSLSSRPKTGFSTPVRSWIGAEGESSGRGLRGWANKVHQVFRTEPKMGPRQCVAMAAE